MNKIKGVKCRKVDENVNIRNIISFVMNNLMNWYRLMDMNIGNIISIVAVLFSIWQFRRQNLITRALDVKKDRVRLSCSFTKKIDRTKYNIEDVFITNDNSMNGYNNLCDLIDGKESKIGLVRLENVTNNNLYDVYIKVNDNVLYRYPVLRANQTIIFELNSKNFNTIVLKGSTFSDEVMFIEFKGEGSDKKQDAMSLFIPKYYFVKNSNSMVKYQWGKELRHLSREYKSLNDKFDQTINHTIWMSIGKNRDK